MAEFRPTFGALRSARENIASSAPCRSSKCRSFGKRRSSATTPNGNGSPRRMRSGRARSPHLVGQDRDAGLFVMEYLDPDLYPNWKSQLRDGILRDETAVAVAERLVAIHAATAGRPEVAAAFRYRRLLLRYPARALSDRDRTRPSRSRAATRGTSRADARDQMRSRAWRRQPEKHPDWPGRPAVHRFGMRLVRRAGFRPRLLPQSPAAQMPMAAGECARLSPALRLSD